MVVASELTSPTPAPLEVTASVVAVEATVVVVVATAVVTAATVVVTAATAVVTEVVTKERPRLRLRHRQRWVDQKKTIVYHRPKNSTMGYGRCSPDTAAIDGGEELIKIP